MSGNSAAKKGYSGIVDDDKDALAVKLKKAKESHQISLALVFWILGILILAYFVRDVTSGTFFLGGWGVFAAAWWLSKRIVYSGDE